MIVKKMREKSIDELNINLMNLLREQFKLRMKIANGKLRHTHLMKKTRRDIARIKHLLHEKKYYD